MVNMVNISKYLIIYKKNNIINRINNKIGNK